MRKQKCKKLTGEKNEHQGAHLTFSASSRSFLSQSRVIVALSQSTEFTPRCGVVVGTTSATLNVDFVSAGFVINVVAIASLSFIAWLKLLKTKSEASPLCALEREGSREVKSTLRKKQKGNARKLTTSIEFTNRFLVSVALSSVICGLECQVQSDKQYAWRYKDPGLFE